ncbi:MAG: hypothetical protein ABIR73_04580 [Usitatibacter sp.]
MKSSETAGFDMKKASIGLLSIAVMASFGVAEAAKPGGGGGGGGGVGGGTTGQDICTFTTVDVGSGANNPGSQAQGTGIFPITGKTIQTSVQGNGCTVASISGADVPDGNIKLEGQGSNANTYPVSCRDRGVGVFPDLATKEILVDGSSVSYDFDTGTAPLGAYGFRARYTKLSPGGGYASSVSPCINLTVGPSTDACEGSTDVKLNVYQAAGQGEVRVGDVGPWTYTFTVLNCTSGKKTVKVQGGTTAWTSFLNWVISAGSAIGKGTGNGNQVTTWTVDLEAKQSQTIAITVNGKVPNTLETWIPISGAWSAAYNDQGPQKTNYTDAVLLQIVP